MKSVIFSALFLVASLIPSAASAAGDDAANRKIVNETIAKARAYLGSDAKLDAVKSLHFRGVLVYGNGDSGTVDIIYAKPLYQQTVSAINGLKETSTLNKTEAWRKAERVDKPGQWQLDLYEPQDIHRMQANVREMLDFMKPPSTRLGKVTYEGEKEIDGVTTRVLRYDHGGGIYYLQYVDPKTGRVVRAENDIGMVFIKSGEKVVDGIRFPEKLVTRFQTPMGEQTLELTYSSITVNEPVDDSIFDMPLLAE